MKKFKALLIKDWYTHKKLVRIPFWITLGFYLLVIIGVAIAYFKGDMNIQITDFSANAHFPMINYIINLGLVMMPGLMSVIFTIILTQGALNEDKQKNCELFHRSQPVSIWKRTSSKYIFGIVSNWLVLLIIAVVNFIIINAVLFAFNQFEFYTALSGFSQGIISYLKAGIIIGSLAYFCSSVFKDKAFFQGIAILVGIQFLFLLFNAVFGWNLPLPMSYLMDLIQNTSLKISETNISLFDTKQLISHNWNLILFNWKTLIQIVASSLLFVAGTFIYKYKEII